MMLKNLSLKIKLKYSYYGTNEIFQLCLVYIAHKRDQIELAKKYFAEYKKMPNSLSLDYLEETSQQQNQKNS